MYVIVSAFVTNINNRHDDRDINTYIEYGKLLMKTNINSCKIIFIERAILNKYFKIVDTYYTFKCEDKVFDYIIENNTIFVMFEKTDNYLYNYINEITKFNVNTDNPGKDTLEYMFVQCHKTEWMKFAIKLLFDINNPRHFFNLDTNLHFIWVDFGIYHMFNNNIELFDNSFKHLHEIDNTVANNIVIDNITINNKIRIASCIHPSKKYHSNIYKNIVWYFAGSVFGGPSDILLRFADLMKSECISIIKERKHLMWEVNIWYLIYLKHPELFGPYNCNHNASIIANY